MRVRVRVNAGHWVRVRVRVGVNVGLGLGLGFGFGLVLGLGLRLDGRVMDWVNEKGCKVRGEWDLANVRRVGLGVHASRLTQREGELREEG